jgi:DNA polymerase IV
MHGGLPPTTSGYRYSGKMNDAEFVKLVTMPQPKWDRIVAHADMDAFYAAVEQLDDPSLRGRPILVGPKSPRGVVLTASYEARPSKVGSAMPMAQARRLCPEALVVPPRFERYEEISATIMRVFGDFSPDVEPLSLDEAFLEMTGAESIFGSPQAMGRKLKAAIYDETGGLTVSVGLSGTKYVAKVASAHQKPNGLTVVSPEDAVAWLAPQSVAKLWGAGAKTQRRLRALKLVTIGDVAKAGHSELTRMLGNAGAHFFDLANARDPRRVQGQRRAKSIGSEQTLQVDISNKADIRKHLQISADKIGKRLRRKGLVAGGVRVKLKTTDFRLLTRQCVLRVATDVGDTLYAAGDSLLPQFEDPGPFRLVGLAAYDLTTLDDPKQLGLLADGEKQRRLETALDQIADRFGDDMVHRAGELRQAPQPRLSSDIDFLDRAGAKDPHS